MYTIMRIILYFESIELNIFSKAYCNLVISNEINKEV